MILLLAALFYALYLAFWFCVIGAALVIYVGFCLLAFLTAVVIEVIRAILARRRPKKPPLRRPPPQAKWSDRR